MAARKKVWKGRERIQILRHHECYEGQIRYRAMRRFEDSPEATHNTEMDRLCYAIDEALATEKERIAPAIDAAMVFLKECAEAGNPYAAETLKLLRLTKRRGEHVPHPRFIEKIDANKRRPRGITSVKRG